MPATPGPVLIIEDDAATRELLRDVLESHGLRCAMAGSAEAGLSLLPVVRPSLIVLDINLPGMDGVSAARQLRATPDTAALKLIGMSAHALAGEIALIESAGFDAFFSKPFSFKALLQRVRQLLGEC